MHKLFAMKRHVSILFFVMSVICIIAAVALGVLNVYVCYFCSETEMGYWMYFYCWKVFGMIYACYLFNGFIVLAANS